jgi:hypothetical protein
VSWAFIVSESVSPKITFKDFRQCPLWSSSQIQSTHSFSLHSMHIILACSECLMQRSSFNTEGLDSSIISKRSFSKLFLIRCSLLISLLQFGHLLSCFKDSVNQSEHQVFEQKQHIKWFFWLICFHQHWHSRSFFISAIVILLEPSAEWVLVNKTGEFSTSISLTLTLSSPTVISITWSPNSRFTS